MGENGLPE